MIQHLKKTAFARWMKTTFVGRLILQHTGDWRYPYFAASWWLSRMLVPRRRVSVADVTFTLSCTNWVTHFRWYLFKSKEQEVRHYIDAYVKNNDVFFDIGTNVGVFTIYAAKRHPNISVYCFEPEYSNLHTLKENIVCNDLMQRTKIHSVAVSNFVGLSMLHIQDVSAGAAAHTESRIPINMTHEGYQVVWSEGVFSATLDYLCEQLGVFPNAMKIDTDGNEDKVLEGAAKTIANPNLRSLVIEMPHENPEKTRYCYKLLESAGFRLKWSDREKTRNEIWVR